MYSCLQLATMVYQSMTYQVFAGAQIIIKWLYITWTSRLAVTWSHDCLIKLACEQHTVCSLNTCNVHAYSNVYDSVKTTTLCRGGWVEGGWETSPQLIFKQGHYPENIQLHITKSSLSFIYYELLILPYMAKQSMGKTLMFRVENFRGSMLVDLYCQAIRP